MPREIKKVRQLPRRACRVTRVRQPGSRISQLVEEGLNHGVNGRQSLRRRILEESGNKVNGVVGRFAKHLDSISRWATTEISAAYFIERVRLDLGELMLHVIRIHGPNLVPGGSAKNLYDLHQLIDSRLTREKRLPEHQFCHDAPCGPDI